MCCEVCTTSHLRPRSKRLRLINSPNGAPLEGEAMPRGRKQQCALCPCKWGEMTLVTTQTHRHAVCTFKRATWAGAVSSCFIEPTHGGDETLIIWISRSISFPDRSRVSCLSCCILNFIEPTHGGDESYIICISKSISFPHRSRVLCLSRVSCFIQHWGVG